MSCFPKAPLSSPPIFYFFSPITVQFECVFIPSSNLLIWSSASPNQLLKLSLVFYFIAAIPLFISSWFLYRLLIFSLIWFMNFMSFILNSFSDILHASDTFSKFFSFRGIIYPFLSFEGWFSVSPFLLSLKGPFATLCRAWAVWWAWWEWSTPRQSRKGFGYWEAWTHRSEGTPWVLRVQSQLRCQGDALLSLVGATHWPLGACLGGFPCTDRASSGAQEAQPLEALHADSQGWCGMASESPACWQSVGTRLPRRRSWQELHMSTVRDDLGAQKTTAPTVLWVLCTDS